MRSFTIEQARLERDALVADASAGQIIEITLDGRPAVRLVPVSQAGDDDAVPAEEVLYGD